MTDRLNFEDVADDSEGIDDSVNQILTDLENDLCHIDLSDVPQEHKVTVGEDGSHSDPIHERKSDAVLNEQRQPTENTCQTDRIPIKKSDDVFPERKIPCEEDTTELIDDAYMDKEKDEIQKKKMTLETEYKRVQRHLTEFLTEHEIQGCSQDTCWRDGAALCLMEMFWETAGQNITSVPTPQEIKFYEDLRTKIKGKDKAEEQLVNQEKSADKSCETDVPQEVQPEHVERVAATPSGSRKDKISETADSKSLCRTTTAYDKMREHETAVAARKSKYAEPENAIRHSVADDAPTNTSGGTTTNGYKGKKRSRSRSPSTGRMQHDLPSSSSNALRAKDDRRSCSRVLESFQNPHKLDLQKKNMKDFPTEKRSCSDVNTRTFSVPSREHGKNSQKNNMKDCPTEKYWFPKGNSRKFTEPHHHTHQHGKHSQKNDMKDYSTEKYRFPNGNSRKFAEPHHHHRIHQNGKHSQKNNKKDDFKIKPSSSQDQRTGNSKTFEVADHQHGIHPQRHDKKRWHLSSVPSRTDSGSDTDKYASYSKRPRTDFPTAEEIGNSVCVQLLELRKSEVLRIDCEKIAAKGTSLAMSKATHEEMQRADDLWQLALNKRLSVMNQLCEKAGEFKKCVEHIRDKGQWTSEFQNEVYVTARKFSKTSDQCVEYHLRVTRGAVNRYIHEIMQESELNNFSYRKIFSAD